MQIQTRHTGPPQVSAAASSAASLAFLNNQKSNGSLSAAAAAAALRNRPQPPTDVANTHTKRLLRRGSNSSTGSGSPRPGLERRTSLTERSLRAQSPARDGSARPAANAPPIPPLPQNLERTESGRQRAASLEPPLRISSPPPRQPGGRGVSLDRAPRSPVHQKQPSNLPKLSEHAELPQRTSVNFSRPMSPPPQSPVSTSPPASPTQQQTGWFAGPVGSGGEPRATLEPIKPKRTTELAASEVSGIQTSLQGVADKPVKKKKKRLLGGGNQGTHLSQGSMEMTGTAVEAIRSRAAANPTRDSAPVDRFEDHSPAKLPATASSPEPAEKFNTRAGSLLARQPSMIDESPELEQQPTPANTGKKVDKPSIEPPRVDNSATPVVPLQTPKKEEENGSMLRKTSSASPARSTHFSPKPEFLDGIKHQPLGRSASPVKSALKHSPSSSLRTASPDVRFSAPSSEAGEANGSVTRKKANRVSFDETPTIVETSTGLQKSRFASPTTKRSNSLDSDDLEDIMTPRPALPGFSSIRERKTEPTRGTTGTTQHAEDWDHSSDHKVGGLLAQDFAKRSAVTQPTTHDPMQPLAPEVTSVEGTGYGSDSESEYSEHPSYYHTPQYEKGEPLFNPPETIAEASPVMQNGAASSYGFSDDKHPLSKVDDDQSQKTLDHIPAIAVQPATPAAEEKDQLSLIMPGSFPGPYDDQVVSERQFSPSVSFSSQPPERQTYTIPTLASQIDDSDSESDSSSIWSDAEEDLPSGPGGFASLNAIVDSPTVAPTPGLALSKHAPGPGSSPAGDAPPSPTAAKWDEATAYWRGLSEQRRKEMEQEARARDDETEESSEDEFEKETSVTQVRRPATPPQTYAQKKPELESPIVLKTTAHGSPVAAKKDREPKLRSSMRNSGSPATSQVEDHSPVKTTLRSSMRNSGAPTAAGRDDSSPARTSLRSSMRKSNDASRSSGEHHLRSSMRNSSASPADPRPTAPRRSSSGLEESRWSVPQLQPAPSKLTNGRPAAATTSVERPVKTLRGSQPPAPSLRRQASDDSVSSFRRQRKSKADGSVSMRRSMRGAAPAAPAPQYERPESPPPRKSGRFSLRSLSPVGRKSEASSNVRATLRGNPPPAEKEPKKSRLKSPSRLGFGRSKKAEVPPSPQTPIAAPVSAPRPAIKASRRLSADSDDDVDVRPSFVSRFADSDDDMDGPTQKELTPVRGIPRRPGEDDRDSTDLDDSDHERPTIPPVPSLKDIEKAHGKQDQPTLTNGNKTSSALSTGSLRKGKEGGGLSASKYAPPPAPTPASPIAAPERPTHKRRLSWLSIGSSKGKRSSSVPPISSSNFASPPPSRGNDINTTPTKPNLLRRSTPTGLPQISEDTNWPLPSPTSPTNKTKDTEIRPTTADNNDTAGPGSAFKHGTMRGAQAPAIQRPDVGKRRNTAEYVGAERGVAVDNENADADGKSVEGGRKRVGFNFESGEPVYSIRTGRKKKFGALRRVFGLDD